ncbi:MAG: hypothetical protein J3R72DRAFT_517314 [Linnemannia gamsii]|nr:MAG: hypothetical protein J3R72DRAFT_517314 [Linnemannia gamsii]
MTRYVGEGAEEAEIGYSSVDQANVGDEQENDGEDSNYSIQLSSEANISEFSVASMKRPKRVIKTVGLGTRTIEGSNGIKADADEEPRDVAATGGYFAAELHLYAGAILKLTKRAVHVEVPATLCKPIRTFSLMQIFGFRYIICETKPPGASQEELDTDYIKFFEHDEAESRSPDKARLQRSHGDRYPRTGLESPVEWVKGHYGDELNETTGLAAKEAQSKGGTAWHIDRFDQDDIKCFVTMAGEMRGINQLVNTFFSLQQETRLRSYRIEKVHGMLPTIDILYARCPDLCKDDNADSADKEAKHQQVLRGIMGAKEWGKVFKDNSDSSAQHMSRWFCRYVEMEAREQL